MLLNALPQTFSNASFNKNAARSNELTTADIVDFVVVERHLVNPESRWRIAGKVIAETPLVPAK